MMHVVAYIHHTADPLAKVCGVFSSRAAAVAAMPPGTFVLPVTWPAYACRNPKQGDTLATVREASGLVAVAPRRA